MVKWPAILCKNISRAETEKNSMGTKTFKFMISTFMNRKYTCNTIFEMKNYNHLIIFRTAHSPK